VASQDSHNKERPTGGLDFEELVRAHHVSLFRFAVSLTRQEHDAADLVQETFRRWAVKGHTLHDLTKVKAWLFTTLHRLFLEGQRRSTRFPQVEVSTVEHELPPVDAAMVQAVDAAVLPGLMAQLDPGFRSAVALFYLEDYTYPEIAEILGIPLGTVKSRIARGMAHLKHLLRHELAVPGPPRAEGAP
jgi:RNA polymerase sigma-70 factor (ECF subfamily)